MKEPTEREWLEGLLPEQEWEFYHRIRCQKCGYEATDPAEFHQGRCWACVMQPWDEVLDWSIDRELDQ